MITPVRVSSRSARRNNRFGGDSSSWRAAARCLVFVFCIAPTIFFHKKKMAGAGVVYHRCHRDWRSRGLFYPGGHSGLADVADTSIPSASAWAQKRHIDLPFSDFESLRQVVIGTLGEEANYLRNVANVAKATTTNLVFSILESSLPRASFSKPDSTRIGSIG